MDNTKTAEPASTLRAEPVRSAYELDDGPGRHRIGLIALASDYATERDFMNMRPNDEVAVFVSRILNVNPCTVENLRTMAPKVSDAVSLIIPEGRLDAVAYSCTSGTVAIGYDAIAASIHAERPGIPVATPITAGLAALARFGAQKVAVLTPYVDDVNGPIARYIEAGGLEVVALTSFLFPDDNDMARIPPEAIYEAALEADRPDADALFISCTAIRAVDVVERIEQALGKPVVTANQALFWQALRAAGYHPPVDGYGSLLRLPSQ
ncbi:MAG: maleate cis-trans isomerase family protein [Hyphomicrobiales bacterium]